MADSDRSDSPAQPVEPTFRRATPEDAYAIAREIFLAGERVDMQDLAGRLAISRATLHRWVRTREHLLDRVLGELTVEFFAQARAAARGQGDGRVLDVVRHMVGITARSEPVRDFVEREPGLAMKLLVGEDRMVSRRLLEQFREVVATSLPDEADLLEAYCRAMVRLGTSLEWSTVAAGDDPEPERFAAVAQALLYAARRGELPEAPFRH